MKGRSLVLRPFFHEEGKGPSGGDVLLLSCFQMDQAGAAQQGGKVAHLHAVAERLLIELGEKQPHGAPLGLTELLQDGPELVFQPDAGQIRTERVVQA